MSHHPLRSVLAATTGLAIAIFTGLPAAADPPTPSDGPTSQAGQAPSPDQISADMQQAQGAVSAFIALDTEAAVDVAASGGSVAQVEQARAETEDVAADVVPAQLTEASAGSDQPQRFAVVTNLMSGILVSGDAEQIRKLSADPHVTGIYRIIPKTYSNASTAEFIDAVASWTDAGATGDGVTVGIIDTGIDYTHADFGGPGTTAAYEEAFGADGTGPIPADVYDPKKFNVDLSWDFAGPEYDASDPAAVGVPDSNPIDSSESFGGGHGSHVAGSAAGYGVTAAGETFTGDYSQLTDLSDWQIGPGMAPEATLVALKVFGDSGGSTNLVIPALDRAADPNGDGDFSDHLDVVNLSLGSDYAPADDPDAQAINRLTALGTVVVASAGNGDDLEDVAGSPGNAVSSIAVANTSGIPTLDGVEVVGAADSSLVQIWPAQNSVAYVHTNPDATAEVVYLGDTFSGCQPFTAEQQALVADKIVWLWWDDDDTTRDCGSAGRSDNAAAAGAAGALLSTESPVFVGGITGSEDIPVAQMTASTTDALIDEAKAGTLQMHIGPSLVSQGRDTSVPDMVNQSSSRGIHGSLGWAKPDVGAPGSNIVSVAASTGTGSANYTGTSMAGPNVAGVAALVRQQHPGWTVAQVKAAIMNTATHDLHNGTNNTGEVYSPARVGAGRVDAAGAVSTSVLVYDTANPAQTSVSFGVVDVSEPMTLTREVTVANTGASTQTFEVQFDEVTGSGGAQVTVSPAQVTVPAGGTASVTLTLTADPTTLAREIDPTMATSQGGLPREFVNRLTGQLRLLSNSGELRLPVQAAPRATSTLTTRALVMGEGTSTMTVTGSTTAADNGWPSFATPTILGTVSPELDPLTEAQAEATSASTVLAGDIRYVGWSSTAPAVEAAGEDATYGFLNVAVTTAGEWANLGAALYPVVDIDIEGDGAAEYEAQVFKYSSTDLTFVWIYDLQSGELVDIEFVNEFDGSVDMGVFDGSALLLPIPLALIPQGSTPTITAMTLSYYAPDGSFVIDTADSFTVNPYEPPLWFESNTGGATSWISDSTRDITVHTGDNSADQQVLMVYPQNGSPQTRAQVVPVVAATTTELQVSGSSGANQTQALVAKVRPKAAGVVTFWDGDQQLGTAAVRNGKATLQTKLGAGQHSLVATFAPQDADAYGVSTSNTVKRNIKKSTSSTNLVWEDRQVSYGTAAQAHVRVVGANASPDGGTVEILEDGEVLATGVVETDGKTGHVTIDLPQDLPVGRHNLTAHYVGNDNVKESTSSKTRLTVEKVASTVTVTTDSWTVPAGTSPTFTVQVAGSGAVPTGTATVKIGMHTITTVRLVNGTATFTLPAVQRTGLVVVTYCGDNNYTGVLSATTMRVS